MEPVSDTPEEGPEEKGPAPVVNPTVRPARTRAAGTAKKAAAKKAPAKKAPAAKKTVAKKAPESKAPAKKAPAKAAAKNAPAKKAPAKAVVKKAPARKAPAKAAAKKAPAKKAPAKKAIPRKAPAKAPATKAPTATATATKAPAAQASRVKAPSVETNTVKPVAEKVAPETVSAKPAATRNRSRSTGATRMAMCASVTQEMINELLPFVVGAGISMDPLETSVSLPGMGEVPVRLGLTVVGVNCALNPDDEGRVRIFVSANGEVSTGDAGAPDRPAASGDAGSDASTPLGVAGMAMPLIPAAPIPVLGEALVAPFVDVAPNGVISVGLDLREAVFVSVTTDQAAPVPEGVDAQVWPGVVAMFGLLLGGVGESLFMSLGEHVGTASIELDPGIGAMLLDLGVRPGPAHVSVSSGLLTVGLAADASVRGAALPVPIAGKRVGMGLASSVVDLITHQLLLRAAGDLPLPFELEVSLGEQSVGGRVRNTRLLPESFPDLRSSLRTEVRTRLLRGQLELSVQSAWLELPSVLPSFVNRLSKRVGDMAALAPLKVKFPAVVQVPLPDMDDTIGVQIDDLRVTTDGIGLVASLA